MRKTIWAAVPLALLALAAPAAARDGGHKVKYRATLAPVQEHASAARDRGGEPGGKAELVDGRRRDRIKLRVRGLEAGAAGYSWELRSAAGDGGACAGEAVDGFRYRSLKVRRHGRGNARGVSRAFAAEDGVSYAVVVSRGGDDVLCGEFERKGGKRKGGEHADDSPAPGDCAADDEPVAEDATHPDEVEEPEACEDEPVAGDDDAGDEDYGDDDYEEEDV